MKRIRKMTALLLILGIMLSLTGCKDKLFDLMELLPGAMNAEKLMEKYDEVNAGREAMEMTILIPISGKATMDEETMNFSVELESKMQMQGDIGDYSEMRIEGEIDDQWIYEKINSYTVVEEDEVVVYNHNRVYDAWERSAQGITVTVEKAFEEKLDEAVARCREKYPIDLTRVVLAEEKQIACNREVYVIEYALTGQELQDMWDELDLVTLYEELANTIETDTEVEVDPEAAELEQKIMDAIKSSVMMDFGLKNLAVNYRLYIDAETFDPVQEEYEIIGVDAVVDGVLDGFMTVIFDIMDEMEVEYDKEEVPEISVDVDDITIVSNGFGFEPVDVPEVPERGLIITAQENFEPDMGDGTYVIQEYGDAVRISVPEGWLPEADWYYGLTLTKQDADQMAIWGATESAVFTMYGEDYTEEDFKATVTGYEEYFKSQGIYHETFQPEVEGYTVYRVNNMRLNAYYAWKPVGDGWLFIEYYDVTVQPTENTFLPMLENISEYDLDMNR